MTRHFAARGLRVLAPDLKPSSGAGGLEPMAGQLKRLIDAEAPADTPLYLRLRPSRRPSPSATASAGHPLPTTAASSTTRLSTNGQEDGHIGIVNEGGVKGVSLPLSSRALPPQWAQAAPITRAAYPQYVQASTALWGPSHDKRGRDGSRINRWSGHDSGRGGEGAQQPH